MAKQKKKRNKRNRYTTGGRLDMRKGGRVKYQLGGLDKPDFTKEDPPIQVPPIDPPKEDPPPPPPDDTPPDDTSQPSFARQSAEAAARGEVPDAAVIPDAVQMGIDPETGQPLKEQQITTMADPTTVGQRKAEGQEPEQVTTGTAQTADMPKDMNAAEITEDELDIVDTQAQVDTAQGTLSDDAIAEAAGVDRVDPTQGADVTIQEGAVAERVVGTLSPEAKATAASASSVGRDNLFNAIIQSAIPLAQSNAQAIQQSVSQQRTIEAQVAEANAQRQQQVVLNNAQSVFQLDMAQFSADQQTSLANSKFLQTVSITEANTDQQSILQNAVLMSQANLAEASLNQQAQIQNAKNFLAMDMANLNAEQQSNILRAQQTQQRLLSNQAATNAAAQFNAASENQTNQFMASLNAQTDQYNISQMNTMEQFNATQANAAAARDAQRAADVEKFNTQLVQIKILQEINGMHRIKQ